MSGDEIVFGEMQVPRAGAAASGPTATAGTRAWPTRSRRRPTCRSSSIAAPPTPSSAMRSATRPSSWAASCWARNASTRPTGQPFVWITQSLEAKHYANTQASFTYTHDSWEEITRERDRLFPISTSSAGTTRIPASASFFRTTICSFISISSRSRFQVAYVVDPDQPDPRLLPVARRRNLAQVGGYYLTADRGDRIALARLANDLENFPNPEGDGGAALSPRLEAELIKMLNRPASPQYVSSPADRVQTAMVFGMLGSFLGVLGVAAAFWLYQLHGRIQDQGDSLKALAHSVDQVAGSQRLAIDTLLDKAGTDNPTQFAERYERAAKARDEARRQLAAQQSINETLGIRTKELESMAAKLAADLETANKTLASMKPTPSRRPSSATGSPTWRKTQVKLQRELDEKTEIAEAADGQKGAEVLRRLNLFRYATYILGALSAALAAAVGYFSLRIFGEAESNPAIVEQQPHQIT